MKITQGDFWEAVNPQVTYIKASQLKPGDAVEGVYTEVKTDEKYKTLKYSILQSDGTVKIINGSGQLDHVMKTVPIKTKVRIVFEGKKELVSGAYKGTKANQWSVYRAKPQALSSLPTQDDEESPRKENAEKSFSDSSDEIPF